MFSDRSDRRSVATLLVVAALFVFFKWGAPAWRQWSIENNEEYKEAQKKIRMFAEDYREMAETLKDLERKGIIEKKRTQKSRND